MSRWVSIAVGFLLVPGGVLAQDQAELLRRHGDLDRHALFQVKAAAVRSLEVAVLTEPSPAVHVFREGQYEAWGRRGGGPAEFASPADIAWSGDAIVVLDVEHRKLVSFDEAGTLQESRSLGNEWANRLFVVGSDTILGAFVPMTRERAVIRIRGSRADTLFSYSGSQQQIRLEAPGSPSLTLTEPFVAQTVWTVLPAGRLAVWRAGSSSIEVLDLEGNRTSVIQNVRESRVVTGADRQFWFDDAIPSEFMGRRGIFDPLRTRARDVVRFPERFPAVLELVGDPRGGIWIRQTTAGSGEVWVYRELDGSERGSIRLPVGRQLLRVAEEALVALAIDEYEVEQIEVYARPQWAVRR